MSPQNTYYITLDLFTQNPLPKEGFIYNLKTKSVSYITEDSRVSDTIVVAEPFVKDAKTHKIILHPFQISEKTLEKLVSGALKSGDQVSLEDATKQHHKSNTYTLTEHLSKEHARHIAKLVFGTDQNLFVKTKGSFVEIRVENEAQILQIQDNGTMMLMKKLDLEFFHPIPNCFQIVQYLIDKGYTL